MTTMRTEDLHNTLDDATMRRIYDQFDKDGNGVLDREECAAALTCIGSQLKFEDLDADGNGEVRLPRSGRGHALHDLCTAHCALYCAYCLYAHRYRMRNSASSPTFVDNTHIRSSRVHPRLWKLALTTARGKPR